VAAFMKTRLVLWATIAAITVLAVLALVLPYVGGAHGITGIP
jgi:hypothetical protein